MGSAPLVTVALFVRNGERYLENALTDLLAQDHPNLELILFDNASADASPAIARRFAESDARIRYLRNDVPVGMVENVNRSIALAAGKYIMFAGVDDEWEPGMVSACVEVLEADDSVVLAYPEGQLIDHEGQPLDRPTDRVDTRGLRPAERLAAIGDGTGSLHMVSGLVRVEAARAIGGVQEITVADLAFVVGLALRGAFARVPERLFAKRVDPDEPVLSESWKERVARINLTQPASAGSVRDVLRELRDVVVQVVLDAPLPLRERIAIASDVLVAHEKAGVRLPLRSLRKVLPGRSYLALTAALARRAVGRSGIVAPLPAAPNEPASRPMAGSASRA